MQPAARGDGLLDKRLETVGRGVGDPPHADPADPLTGFLDCDRNQGLLFGLSTPDALLEATQIRLVDFDVARQPIAPRPHHGPTRLVQPRPRRLVAPEPEDPPADSSHSPQSGGW